MNIELISFTLCPFAQRAIITLNEKETSCEINYIDLDKPPVWFNKISPLGKVPLLKVGEIVLFESVILNEYLDEAYPPALHPEVPLERAKHRGWIEFGPAMLLEQVAMVMAKDENGFQQKKEVLGGSMARVAAELGTGPFFRGGAFSLIDAAYAPLFMCYRLLSGYWDELLEFMPTKLRNWSDNLLERESVKNSIVDDFSDQFSKFFQSKGSFILKEE